MTLLKKVGSFLGEVTGTITGEPIKLIGKKLNNEYILEIGDGVKQASIHTGNTVGKLADGTWNTASGLIQKDEKLRDKGINELKDTAVQTAKGIGYSIKNTYNNGKEVFEGVVNQDKDQIIKGAKGLGKTATVAALSVGVLDLIDAVDIGGAEDIQHVQAETVDHADMQSGDSGDSEVIDTRNDSLAGENHPVTDVPFVEKDVALPSGEVIHGVFPEFDSVYTVTLPESMYLNSDDSQFSYATQSLAEQINQDPALASDFTQTQLTQIFANQTPEGYTWHHSEEPGRLELVDEKIHAETAHTGGRELWGGGGENR